MKKTFKVKGMHCNSCASLIERILLDKTNNVSVNYTNNEAHIDFDEKKISEHELNNILKKEGYELVDEGKKEGKETNINTKIIIWIFIIGGILIASLLLIRFTELDIFNLQIPNIPLPQFGEKTSLAILFIAGLLTGFHCISMCGGFVISYTTKNALKGYKGFTQHLVYGGSKVISYALIGGFCGLIGGIFAFSIQLRGVIAILAGIFMIFYALSMFGLNFFRRFQFNPKFLMRASSEISTKTSGYFKTPFFTGLLNGLFLACGPLQAMYLYAAGTGNFFTGASSLAIFGLGTLPVMLGFGSIATMISHKTTTKILKISAILVLILGLIMINRGLSLTGNNFNFDAIKNTITNKNMASTNNIKINNGVQDIDMNVDASGYSPNSFVIKKGVPVNWNINVKELTSCNGELVMTEYGIDKQLKNGLNMIEFTPTKTGTITFTCGMGMLHGTFIVTDDGTATTSQIQQAANITKSPGTCNMGTSGSSCGCGMMK